MRSLLIVVLTSASCGSIAAPPPPPTFADQHCATTGLAMANAYTTASTARLAIAVDSTAAEIADWHERGYRPNAPRAGRSHWRDVPPQEPVALCYYDGPFDNYAPPGPPGSRHPPFERALLIVDARAVRLVSIAPAANLPRLK